MHRKDNTSVDLEFQKYSVVLVSKMGKRKRIKRPSGMAPPNYFSWLIREIQGDTCQSLPQVLTFSSFSYQCITIIINIYAIIC